MTWARILAALAGFFSELMVYMRERQLLEAGRASQRADDAETANAKVAAALAAGAAAERAGVQPDDPNRRD